MTQRTVIITGGNSGLGFQCAKTIASNDHNWHIVIASRNSKRSLEAIDKIKLITDNDNLSTLNLDLSSLVSVRNFVDEYKKCNLPPLKGLVCNAGIIVKDNQVTEEGYERTFGVNHLGHFLLVDLLVDELVQPARIVVVSSNTHNPNVREGRFAVAKYLGGKDLADPDKVKELSWMQRYTTSKLCNILFTYELDRRCKQKNMDITVNAFDPGFTPGTNLMDGGKFKNVLIKSPIIKIPMKISGIVSSTPKKSGKAMARLLLDPLLEKTSGKYFQILEEIKSSEESYDKDKAHELWDSSIEMTKGF
ncbi:MAG: SDR family NAD(P)-dependent oxidoreductase [Candidatus Lokiarchaeota archaeon]|nr:SDR family NAD(P)-dependent oxidoreductase [Candidatus Lokiarchaeota archaeon]